MLIIYFLSAAVILKFSNGIETCVNPYCFSYDSSTGSKTYDDAVINCSNQNKFLLEIKTEDFQNIVTQTITNWLKNSQAWFTGNQIWLNAYKINLTSYQWGTSKEIVTYFNWDTDQPMTGAAGIMMKCSTTDCKWVGTTSFSAIGTIICYNDSSLTPSTSLPIPSSTTTFSTITSTSTSTTKVSTHSSSSIPTSTSTSTSTSTTSSTSILFPSLSSITALSSTTYVSFHTIPTITNTAFEQNSTGANGNSNNEPNKSIIISIVIIVVVIIVVIIVLIVLWKKGKLKCTRQKKEIEELWSHYNTVVQLQHQQPNNYNNGQQLIYAELSFNNNNNNSNNINNHGTNNNNNVGNIIYNNELYKNDVAKRKSIYPSW